MADRADGAGVLCTPVFYAACRALERTVSGLVARRKARPVEEVSSQPTM